MNASSASTCLLLFFALVTFLAPGVKGLRCYACVQSGSDDTMCEKDPKQVPNSIINCNKKYCVIRRIEYVDKPGSVFSFYRGCEQQPEYINTEITDSQFKTYYRSCTTDLCNSGDGTGSSGGGGSGNGIGAPDDDGPILVPGLGNSATTSVVMTSALVLAMLVLQQALQ